MHSGAPVAQERTAPPTPLGRDSLTYPAFATVDRRLFVVVLKARVLTEDLGGGFGEFVQVKVEISLVFAEALSCCVRQACQAAEPQRPLVPQVYASYGYEKRESKPSTINYRLIDGVNKPLKELLICSTKLRNFPTGCANKQGTVVLCFS